MQERHTNECTTALAEVILYRSSKCGFKIEQLERFCDKTNAGELGTTHSPTRATKITSGRTLVKILKLYIYERYM